LEKKLFTVNFLGQVAITKAVLPAMVARRSGHIVYISSLAGLMEVALRCFYGGSKAAASAYMESLRAEIAQYNIAVTNIYPGLVQSSGVKNALGSTGKGAQAKDSDASSHAMTGEAFASLALRHIANRSQEVVITQAISRVFLWIKLHLPGLSDLLAPAIFRRITEDFMRENS
jgi:short-subunit dehydrogenase